MIPYDRIISWQEWSRIPVDDFGYIFGREFVWMSPHQRKELLEIVQLFRWDESQWRNRGGTLRKFLVAPSFPSFVGKRVMDFGCGLGLDGIEYAKMGALVIYADIHPWTLMAAQQAMCGSTGIAPEHLCVVSFDPPYAFPPHRVDLFWSMGVLHHFPWGMDLLQKAMMDWLVPTGEARICLYSDRRWKEITGTDPNRSQNVWEHPKFGEFVRACDSVGQWADWYDEEKLRKATESFATVAECEYLCDGQFIGAVLKRKGE